MIRTAPMVATSVVSSNADVDVDDDGNDDDDMDGE